jgi:peptidyl-prolyl cis-trans isomerase B (cyclophilin B)
MPRLDGMATIVMTVKGKAITIELDGTNAPLTAGNFVDLVQRGVYTGTLFHRVVSKPQPFVAQGGDPQSKDSRIPAERYGTGGFIAPGTGQERRIPLEIKPVGATSALYGKSFEVAGVKKPPVLRHRRGAIAMARSANVNSASSQFYFTLSDLDFLDGNYAVFGKVTSGMDVVDQIKQGDRIESAKVTKGAENLRNGGMK